MRFSPSLLLKQAAGGFVAKVVGAGIAFLVSVLFARHLGPEGFGVYAMTMTTVNIIATIAMLGLPMLLARQVAIYSESEQWGLLKGIVLRGHQWVIVAVAIIVVLCAIGMFFFVPQSWLLVSMLGMLFLPLLALNQIRAGVLRGLHFVVLADIPELFLRHCLVLVLICTVVYFTEWDISASGAIGIQLIAVLITYLFGIWLLREKMPVQIAHVSADFEDRRWFSAGATFLVIALVTVVEGQLSLLILGGLAGPEFAGLYQAAVQLVSLVVFGLFAVNMSLQPKLAAAWSVGDKQKVQGLASEASRLGVLVALLAGGGLLVFSEQALALFGASYLDAAPALRVLVIGHILNAFAGSCGMVLVMTGYQREFLRGILIALMVNVTLCFVLIPYWGVIGGAVAASAGLVTWNAYLMVRALQLTGIRTAFSMRKNYV
ncbi:flippase [Mariprofundus sp. KV]|uniref:flippase n=1 Tax=Mariprofundus sp. KV TaxID=2608715 RepID=UPI0015A045A2|nr:flippase [Mariprofundus sp. KV]